MEHPTTDSPFPSNRRERSCKKLHGEYFKFNDKIFFKRVHLHICRDLIFFFFLLSDCVDLIINSDRLMAFPRDIHWVNSFYQIRFKQHRLPNCSCYNYYCPQTSRTIFLLSSHISQVFSVLSEEEKHICRRYASWTRLFCLGSAYNAGTSRTAELCNLLPQIECIFTITLTACPWF